ncbi:MAG: response regulator transcription factor [Chloroflexota bacterium]
MSRQVILVVDDEAPMRKYISTNLKARGYAVLTAEDGTEALKLIDENTVDLLILDIMMPGPDGLEVLRRVRRDMEIPVVMLSARGRETDKVEALDAGADDYLTKPFGVEELLARVRAALRRVGPAPSGTLPPYRSEALEIDFGARRVRLDGADVSLTPKEYDVLAYLARNAGKVVTHRQILQSVWGAEYGDEADYVWTYVRRLRRKLEPDQAQPRYVLTEAGVGYRMAESE